MIVLYILLGTLGLLLLYILFLGVCSLLVSPRREYSRDSRFYRALLHSATGAVLRLLRVKVHVKGLEKLPKDQKLLFVSNHRSNFDPIITWQALRPWKLAFISKPENFKIPFFGRIIRRCCFLPIDRQDPREAMKTINQASELLRSREVSIGVYPEGTRSKTGELLPFHNGVFKIARKADAAVAVLAVTGTEQIAGRTPFKTTHVQLKVLEVFTPEQIRNSKPGLIGTAARHLMETNIKEEEKVWQQVT